jgi:hypothetical protein
VLEVGFKTLAEEFQSIRKRWHDFRDSVQSRLSSNTATGENRTLTMRDVYMFCGGCGMIYAFFKMMKWTP